MNVFFNIKFFLLALCCLSSPLLIGQNENYIPNQLIVKWKEKRGVARNLDTKNIPKAHKLTTILKSGVELWKVDNTQKKGLKALAKQLVIDNPNIEYAEPNYKYFITQNPLYTDCTHEDLELKKGADDYISNENITYKAANVILATNVIGDDSQIKYLAEKRIRLKPGFRSSKGSKFRASIVDCDGRDDVNDIRYEEQWALHNSGQNGGKIDADIDAPGGWLINKESPMVKVAIIDTGVDWKHEDLVDNIWQNLEEDFDRDGSVLEWSDSLKQWIFDPDDENGVDDDGNGKIDDFVGWDFVNNDNDPSDDNGHGTYVAGVLGAKGDNGLGIAGVTTKVQMAAIKYLDEGGGGTTSGAIEALKYALDNEMQISNASWGGSYSESLKMVIAQAANQNHLFITAAGNNGKNTDIESNRVYPAAYDLENIISVGASDNQDQLALFSNYGNTTVDLVAPGKGILTCQPNNGYITIEGTSLAAPYVTGACALLLDLFPNKEYFALKQSILSGVDIIPALNGKVASGGRLNLCKVLGGCNGTNSCAFTDSLALVALYTATNGANWEITWDLTQNFSTWHGVRVNSDGCLVGLQLPNNNLIGTIPPAIGNLAYLQTLNLSNNELKTAIPVSIGYLSKLEVLDLSNNQVEGRIPLTIGQLDSLSVLRLNNNQLNGEVTKGIGNLSNLKILKLNNNNLEEQIPETISQLTNLDTLFVNDNRFSGCLPSSFTIFCPNTQFDFSNNPAILGGGDFSAFCDNGRGDCNDCHSLDSLVLLDFQRKANVSIWDTVQPINEWTGVQLNSDGCVVAIRLPNSGLSGSITSKIGTLTQLRHLDVSGNQLSGTIPQSIGNLSNLLTLNLNNNTFTSSIPLTITYLYNLHELILSYNQLTGTIPKAIVQLENLQILHLNDNQLAGCFPQNFKQLCTILDYNFENNVGLPNEGDFINFCNTENNMQVCTEPVWPGDFNNDGIVNHADMLFWGRACIGSEGPTRPNASNEWNSQNSPDWSSVVGNVNGKHQDGNGDGVIDTFDLQVLYKNYGQTTNKTSIANHITNGISYELHRVGPVENGEGTEYDLKLKHSSNTPIKLHGVACSINFGDNFIKEVKIDTTNSALHPEHYLSLYDTISKTLDFAITRTCKPDLLTDARIATLIIITNNVAMEDPIKIKRGHRIVSSNLFLSVGGSTFYDDNQSIAIAAGNLQVTVSVTPVQCEQLGAAEVRITGGQAPYNIEWSTGATTEKIANLQAGSYRVTVTDAINNSKEYDIEVEEQFTPIYDENGALVRCDPTECPDSLTLQYPPIPSGLHRAAISITARGSITANTEVNFRAGEMITLLPGFTTSPQSSFYCTNRRLRV